MGESPDFSDVARAILPGADEGLRKLVLKQHPAFNRIGTVAGHRKNSTRIHTALLQTGVPAENPCFRLIAAIRIFGHRRPLVPIAVV